MCCRRLNEGVLRWDRRGGIFSTPRSKGMGLQGVENTLTIEETSSLLPSLAARVRALLVPILYRSLRHSESSSAGYQAGCPYIP